MTLVDFHSRRERLLLAVDDDLAVLLFELVDIIGQGMEKELGMLRRHNDACMHSRLGYTRQNACVVDDEFSRRMRNDGKVGIDSFGFLLAELDRHLLLLLFWLGCVGHDSVV